MAHFEVALITVTNAASCIIRPVVCLWVIGVSAFAASSGTIVYHDIDGVPDTIIFENYAARAVDPRFKYFSDMSFVISMYRSKATCTGTVLTDPQYSTKLTITLQKSSDGRSRSTVKLWNTGSLTGEDSIVLEKAYYLTKGYSYRLMTEVKVSTGAHSETATSESNTDYY